MADSQDHAPAAVPDPDSAVSESLPSEWLPWLTVAVTLAAAVSGALIFLQTDPELNLDVEGFAVFAPVFFAAQAIERLLEPLASFYNPTTPQKDQLKVAREVKIRAERALASAVAGDPAVLDDSEHAAIVAMNSATADELSRARGLRTARANRKLLWFMVATVLACLLSGVLGLGILQAMATEHLKEGLGAIDVGLTGVVIGAGTKPLHDLLERVQKAKENADAATKPTQMLPGTPGASGPT